MSQMHILGVSLPQRSWNRPAEGIAEPSIVIGSDGLANILYKFSGGPLDKLKMAHCDDVTCSSATSIDAGAALVGSNGIPSIAIGTDGLAIVSYGTGQELRIAHCNDVNCSDARKTIVDDKGQTGFTTSIAIGVDGLPVISYYAPWSEILKVAHCEDPITCVPQ